MKFSDIDSRFMVWVQAPSPACHIVETPDEVLEFLVHKDGLNIGIDRALLKANMDDPANWKFDADGMAHSWAVAYGFHSVWVYVVTPLPTLLEQKCLYCRETDCHGECSI